MYCPVIYEYIKSACNLRNLVVHFCLGYCCLSNNALTYYVNHGVNQNASEYRRTLMLQHLPEKMEVIKLIVIGPVKSGKSTVSNFLADATEIPNEYRPTQGVRILEFEMQDMNVKNKHAKADVELWDCSGDQKFESCWPVIRKDANGVVFVLSDANRDNTRELEKFYDYFVVQSKLGPRNCVLIYLTSDINSTEVPKKLPSVFSRVSQVACNLENDGNKLKMDFQAFVATLLTKIQEQTAQEESIIVDTMAFRK